MNHSLGILFTFGTFFTKFELQLQEATKVFSYFWLQLVRMESSKRPCQQFLITFLLFEILAYIIFLFPLKLVLKIGNTSHIFFEELWAQFCETAISSNVRCF